MATLSLAAGSDVGPCFRVVRKLLLQRAELGPGRANLSQGPGEQAAGLEGACPNLVRGPVDPVDEGGVKALTKSIAKRPARRAGLEPQSTIATA
jgi:hypothetical protein